MVRRWQTHRRAARTLPASDDRLGNPEPARGTAHRLHGPAGVRVEVDRSAEYSVQVGCHPLIEIGRGAISKMSARLDGPNVQYAFRLGDAEVPVNPLIGT